ncbi:hypothetical protein BST42_18630 [Mycolicibacterium rhodesiae]|uniref:Methyltransferase FkbM domain-containing protein n=2 Tax=Mycolicibacterium rhodesiae TaxID=36814 RepID=A0A1X0IQL4_MYCRH|nr:hypothetical protein BST42_18630 [Mycolicibacterium rhodesiae]
MLLLSDVGDCGVGRRLAFNGSYDEDKLDIYRKFINPDTRLLVVGAHVGAVMFPLARLAGEVVGIEANPTSYRLLAINSAINGITNCDLRNFAAFDTACSLDFVASKANSGGAKVMPSRQNFEFFYDKPDVITVRAAPLDDELDGEFDVIVMDIEGAEYRAMAGMQRILSRARHFICEVVPNHMDHVDPHTFDEFVARIPGQFKWFSLSSGGPVVSRNEIGSLYATIRREHFFGGADMICSTDPVAGEAVTVSQP